MSELTMSTSERAEQEWTTLDLSARAGVIARSVAEVLEQRCSDESGAAEAVEFLRRWADSTTSPPAIAVSALDKLAARFGLSAEECDLLLLAGLPEEHEGVATTFRALHLLGEPYPSAGLAALVLGGTTQARSLTRELLIMGPAVKHGLIRVEGPGTLFERSLVLAPALWEALHGYDAWPSGLPRVTLEPAPPGLTSWLQQTKVQRAIAAVGGAAPRTLLINGDDELITLSRCAAVAEAAGVELVAARVDPGDAAGIALVAAHAAARGGVPLLVIGAAADGSGGGSLAVEDLPGPVLVCATTGSLRTAPDRAMLVLPADPVSVADQREAWTAAVPHLASQAPMLAARHPLDPALTAQVAIDVEAQGGDTDVSDISALIRARAAVTLPAGVELVTPAVAWTQLVMPEEGGWQLRDAVARLDHQSVVLDDWGLRQRAHASRGARLLFTGPPGTGKSLAASAVATAAGTELLIVDVSRVVSKWLGETEKNLAAAFDAAERTQAVLFLDEADALFATRTEISDAHDRYANLETAYLLQRLDRFDGLAILATNFRFNIDAAFLRRMDFVVEFPLPDLTGRRDLWALHLPTDVLNQDVDIDAISRLYPVPGGWIRNAAVAAAFVAAAAGDRISQQHLVAAMRREYAKASLPFPGEPPRRRQ